MTRYAAIILAAGQASRYRAAGGLEPTKLVATHAGEPLVRHVAQAALLSGAEPVFVVTGHARDVVETAVVDLSVRCIHNPDFAQGLSTSLQAGIVGVPDACAGAVVLLGDMPSVTAETIDRVIGAATSAGRVDAAVLLHHGQRGNPVLLCRSLFARVSSLSGDMGARKLLGEPGLRIVEVQDDTDSILIDVDEPADLRQLR